MTTPCETVLHDCVMQSVCVMVRRNKAVDSAMTMTRVVQRNRHVGAEKEC